MKRRGQACMKAITDGDLTGSVGVHSQGRDELSRLERGINQLLDRVRRDAVAQREAHAQQEALQMQLLQSQKIFELWPGVSEYYTINAALGRKLKIGIVQRGQY